MGQPVFGDDFPSGIDGGLGYQAQGGDSDSGEGGNPVPGEWELPPIGNLFLE